PSARSKANRAPLCSLPRRPKAARREGEVMPEYLAPGVYVEEVSYRAKSIEGVSTTTTGFIGPARYGPIDMEPDIITSLGEFERVYGDRERLEFDTGTPGSPLVMDN